MPRVQPVQISTSSGEYVVFCDFLVITMTAGLSDLIRNGPARLLIRIEHEPHLISFHLLNQSISVFSRLSGVTSARLECKRFARNVLRWKRAGSKNDDDSAAVTWTPREIIARAFWLGKNGSHPRISEEVVQPEILDVRKRRNGHPAVFLEIYRTFLQI